MSKYSKLYSLFRMYILLILAICSRVLLSDDTEQDKNKICLNSTNKSVDCTNASVNYSIVDQGTKEPLSTVTTTTKDTSAGAHEATGITVGTTAALETNPSTPSANVTETENKVVLSTLHMPYTNSTVVPNTNHNFTQENATFTTNATSVESTTSSIEVSTTIVNTTKVPDPYASLLPTDSSCSCDLTINLCDNNCCCDSDCSKEDRMIFTSCYQNQPFALDPRYCYQTQFIYHNNSELKMTWFQEGLFCIMDDNLPVTVRYKNRNQVTSLKEFNALYESRMTSSWPIHTVKQHVFQPLNKYIAGSVLWSHNRGSLVPFGIPIKVANGMCQSTRAVHFLQDYSSSCSHPVPSSLSCEADESYSAAFYHKNITILSRPHMINQTETNLILEQCSNSSCIPIIFSLCSQNLEMPYHENCNTSKEELVQSPVFNNELGICYHVVKHVKYVVYHNGTMGLTKVVAYMTLANITLSSVPQEHFIQHFSIEFRWHNKENIFKRSGRPGYLVGKPVMAGKKVTRISKEENTIDKVGILLSNKPSDWLSIPTVRQDGSCHFNLRYPVTFGDNNRMMCLLPINMSNVATSTSCALLQKQILTLLSGDAINNITEAKQFNIYVATFGDSRVEDVGDWVQILLMNVPGKITSSFTKNNYQLLGCKSIITSAHIDIVYAHVGALANPQAKILGVALTFGKPQDLEYPCNSQCKDPNKAPFKNVQLMMSVTFTDVTQQAETHFAEPPVYEVRLAYDFFYPFFSYAVTSESSICVLFISLVIVTLV